MPAVPRLILEHHALCSPSPIFPIPHVLMVPLRYDDVHADPDSETVVAEVVQCHVLGSYQPRERAELLMPRR
jgi:hypothetical protein